ncbi:MAG: hypothetical protein V4458_00925 [Pseudomonadota bacterium]|nr:hypothetical protein [Afipia sp.]
MSNILPSASNSADDDTPTLPEVEFALVLQRIINSAKDDPAALRQNIYELARMKLRKEAFNNNPREATQLARALETAIIGVEAFAQRSAGVESSSRRPAHIPDLSSRSEPLPASTYHPIAPQPLRVTSSAVTPPPRPPLQIDHQPDGADSERTPSSLSSRFVIGTFVVLIVLSVAALQRIGFWEGLRNKIAFNFPAQLQQSKIPPPEKKPAPYASSSSTDSARPPSPLPASSAAIGTDNSTYASRTVPPDPVLDDSPAPTTYGTYAVANGQLVELELLPAAAPDRRVAISSTIKTPSQTTLANGSPTFIVYRRDLASIPTEQIELRAVAKITRTMKFDAKAKSPEYASEDLWSIRNLNYKLKVSPAPGNSEMLVIRSDSVLPAGRYVLILKRQAYDFAIAGPVTDPNQCLERIEAANGVFYSPCKAG